MVSKKVKIPNKYSDFVDVFLEEEVLLLLEQTEFNQHTIELEKGKQPPYGLIYSLGLMKLEALKTYIEIHLKTEFIQPSKSPVGALILYDKKPDWSFYLYVDYQGLTGTPYLWLESHSTG